MCLIVDKDSQIRRADREVECWKVLSKIEDGGLCSKYAREPYELGEEKVICDELKIMSRINCTGVEMVERFVGKGFHTYANSFDAEMCCDKNEVIVRCIIPVGAHYIEGTVNGVERGYVSDRLIVGKEVV